MTQPHTKNGQFYKTWTEEEVAILRQNYSEYGIVGVRSLLPRHNDGSIRTKAYHLGLTRQQRTYTDDGVLTYPDVPTAAQHYGISNKTLYGLIASGNVREGVSFDYLTE